eukprot:430322-Pleurochrysis_carterae.AAC.1
MGFKIPSKSETDRRAAWSHPLALGSGSQRARRPFLVNLRRIARHDEPLLRLLPHLAVGDRELDHQIAHEWLVDERLGDCTNSHTNAGTA